MTTNRPEVVAYHHINKENPEHRGVSLYHDESCTSTLMKTEPLIRLSDYETLQAELNAHKASRIAYASEFPLGADGTPDVGSIHENIKLLKKDAEFGRSVLSKREPGKSYGCHCDLEEGMEPDECVIDTNERHNCIYAAHIDVKEQCKYWIVIATDAAIQKGEE